MNIENAVRTLTDLSAVDDQLASADSGTDAGDIDLESRRAELRGTIPEVVLAAYDALARVHRKPVVVGVQSAHCCGCHLRLPPQLDASIRRRQSLSACPHCRRLLYPAPPCPEPETTGQPARPGAIRRRSGRPPRSSRATREASSRSRGSGAPSEQGPRAEQRLRRRRRSADVTETSISAASLSLSGH